MPTLVAYEQPRRDIGFHFVDQVAREARAVAGIEAITAHSYTVRSTINPQLQRAVEATLQEGLCALRAQRRPALVPGLAEANLADAIQAHRGRAKSNGQRAALAAGAAQCPAAAL